jgi:spoIIIJ-associated protein
MAVNRALAELDFAPGELEEDQYEVVILQESEEGFLGVGGKDAQVEVRLLVEDDFFGPPGDEVDSYDFPEDEEEDEDFVQPEAASPALREFLTTVLGHLGLQPTIRIVETADTVAAEVSGEDMGVFIGKRGQTLDAIEYLASIVLYPRPDARKRVELDAEGYKERRRKSIERVAERKAQEAVRRGQPVQLEPMTPAERKIVHVALKDRRDVATESTGKEPYRSVVITPQR